MDIPTYLDDLDSLTNIIDLLVISPKENDTYDAEEQVDMIGTIMQLMYDYVIENPTHIHNATFHEDMMESVEELIRTSKIEDIDNDSDDDELFDDLGELVNNAIDLFYMQIMPRRSTDMSASNTKATNTTRTYRTRQVLARLNAMTQPVQRSAEWYEYRHSLITASNAYKIFDTPSTQNQLIYEKCLPLPVATNTNEKPELVNEELVPTVNVSSPMHWGNKYEPVSIMYYENMHGTHVGEYGCIQHSKYPFLGASPDGIVDNPKSEKYGQMLEIKNIVNRNITGVPLKAYWVQMQLQLEVCDLEECDFLETRFKEYSNYDEFISDSEEDQNLFTKTRNNKLKGIILYFIDRSGVPVYEYKPLDMDHEEYIKTWEPEMRYKHETQGHRLMWPLYWWLEEVSCVLVERNRLWFSQVINKISSFWDTILLERKTGYAHRAPMKRKTKDDGLGKCLISINGTLIGDNTPAVSNSNEKPQNTMDNYLVNNSEPPVSSPKNVVHIRTQSFDDVT